MASEELLSLIRDNMGASVPFALHAGVRLDRVADGTATATLPERPFTLNHLATAHAGAIFCLAETASGAAMAGTFADQIFEVRPIVQRATVEYLRVGRGDLVAKAHTRTSADDLRTSLADDGRVEFWVDSQVQNTDAIDVAHFAALWIVKRNQLKPATPQP